MTDSQDENAAPALPQRFIAELRSIAGDRAVKTGEDVNALDPGEHPENLGASAVIFPAATDEVAAIVNACAKWHVPIVPHGGRTGLVGGGISRPGQIVLSLTRMNRIERLDPAEGVAVVGGGVTLQQLQDAARDHGMEPGIDLAARGSATIGGMISTNAGGVMALRNGVMRHRVLGLEAVLPDGSVYCDMTRVVKNSAGYDLKQLLIGAEGTLGIVTRAAVKLDPLPAATATALFGLPSTNIALHAIRLARGTACGTLRAAEVMWQRYFHFASSHRAWTAPDYDPSCPVHLLLSLGGADEAGLQSELANLFGALTELGTQVSAIVAGSAAQEKALWRLRDATDLVYRAFPAAPSYDISVPLSEIDAYLERCLPALSRIEPDLTPLVFGHLGDGNLHIILNRAGAQASAGLLAAVEDVLYSGIRALGGSFSAEHGVGSKRIHALNATADPVKLALMRRIKHLLDPAGLFNPGKLFA
jgi:FAD/FMN-containing dehydrogenase